ncbi:hypothetical protein [Falsiroseomonas oryziterrae]|nr:hypothetical protein [Roseomonas sp. NPKOSM-4]
MLRLIFTLLAIPLLAATACAPMGDTTPKVAAPMETNYNNGNGGA